MIVKPEVYN